MAATRTIQRAFSGGEISPEMYGRSDDAKYQAGLSLCRNFIAKPQGPVENRPGLGYVCDVKDSTKFTRIISFIYNTTQTMLIELGAGYIRFHTHGATLVTSGTTPYEITNPYSESVLRDIHYVQSGDVLTLTHPNYPTMELRRLGALSWELVAVNFGPPIAAPATCTAAPTTTDPSYDYSYVVTAIAQDGISESMASVVGTCNGNLYTAGGFNTITWAAVTGALRYQIYRSVGGVFGYIGSTPALSIIDDNIAPDLALTPPVYDGSFSSSGIESVDVVNGGHDYGTVTTGGPITSVILGGTANDYTYGSVEIADPTGYGAVLPLIISDGVSYPPIPLGFVVGVEVANPGHNYSAPVGTVVGDGSPIAVTTVETAANVENQVTLAVSDPTGSGAELSPIIVAGVITGVAVLKQGTGYTNPTVTVNNAAGGSGAVFGTIAYGTLGLGTAYPAAVSYYEQRRVLGGGNKTPLNLWMTASGTEKTMSYSLPLRDNDRIAIKLAARESGSIRHICPLNPLIVLTSEAEYRVASINSDAVTPTSISVRPQSYVGANNAQPAIVNNTLIYAASRGGHIRECSYNWQANGYTTGDLSLRAAHLFDGLEVLDIAYSKAPLPLLWFVSSSGNLVAITYVPEQQVGSWHWHDTKGGKFESCAVVAEDSEDVLYVVVRRRINGNFVRYIERLSTRQFVNLEDAVFVDSAISFDGTNTSATTMIVSGGLAWDSSEELTLTASSASFAFPATTDVGDQVVLRDDDPDSLTYGTKYFLTITSTTSTTVAKVRVDRLLGASFRHTAMTTWAFARNSFTGLGHLEGELVNILSDGAVHPPQVVTSGRITLAIPGVKVHAGLPITADLLTLPLAAQIDGGYGSGRPKNVNKAWIRVLKASGIFVGPNADLLREVKQRTVERYGSAPDLKWDELEVMTTPAWAADGRVFVRQTAPLPISISALTMEVSIGG